MNFEDPWFFKFGEITKSSKGHRKVAAKEVGGLDPWNPNQAIVLRRQNLSELHFGYRVGNVLEKQ